MFIIKMLKADMCLDSGKISHKVITCKEYEVVFRDILGSYSIIRKEDSEDGLECIGSLLYERSQEFDGLFLPEHDVGKNTKIPIKEIIVDGGESHFITCYEVFVCNENGKTIDKY